MPNAIVKSFAKQSGKSIDDVEDLWAKAYSLAKKNPNIKDENKYAYTVGILKKMLNVEEDFGISVDGPAALDTGVPASGNLGVFADKIGKIQKRKYKVIDYLKSK